MRISDWSSDVCSSDLSNTNELHLGKLFHCITYAFAPEAGLLHPPERIGVQAKPAGLVDPQGSNIKFIGKTQGARDIACEYRTLQSKGRIISGVESEEHTYELQSIMRISYDVYWLK